MKEIHRRGFMKFAGLSLGIGTLYRVIPALGADSALPDQKPGCGRAHGPTSKTPDAIRYRFRGLRAVRSEREPWKRWSQRCPTTEY